MTERLRIVIGQLNFLVGDINGNTDKMIEAMTTARDAMQADLIVFPELSMTAYPPEDLLLRTDLYEQVETGLQCILNSVTGIDVVIGYPCLQHGKRYNAAAVLHEKTIVATYFKQTLPNYAVFDEERYFIAGTEPCIFDIKGYRFGLTICEDLWQPRAVKQAVGQGAELIININASPFHSNKKQERMDIAKARVQENKVPVVYVNQVGGQDELVFDGGSFAMDATGNVFTNAKEFEEELVLVEFDGGVSGPQPVAKPLHQNNNLEKRVYQALVMGVRDYVHKNGFPGVVIGLSGGIDSALTCVIAVDALGADKVEVVLMPSQYTADMSLEDARKEAEILDMQNVCEISVTNIFEAVLASLEEEFSGLSVDTTEENIQARIRGMLLMAISNKSGKLVLTTGNKSEMAVGYATLYGDMAGGFAVIKDVPKTLVYRLAQYRNSVSRAIPQRVIEREPSAELAPEQKDSDSLPPYETLDPIIERYVELDESVEAIIEAGYDADVVRSVVAMIDRNEYKRRQAAPGVRISAKAFGRDRRYPITSGFRHRL
ncbi:MAG: NAD+ synthase [Gammaproteobacteria bacterium]|nr:MAG: NAD+ synthase [Gammaproteobacteria bacterium]